MNLWRTGGRTQGVMIIVIIGLLFAEVPLHWEKGTKVQEMMRDYWLAVETGDGGDK